LYNKIKTLEVLRSW